MCSDPPLLAPIGTEFDQILRPTSEVESVPAPQIRDHLLGVDDPLSRSEFGNLAIGERHEQNASPSLVLMFLRPLRFPHGDLSELRGCAAVFRTGRYRQDFAHLLLIQRNGPRREHKANASEAAGHCLSQI